MKIIVYLSIAFILFSCANTLADFAANPATNGEIEATIDGTPIRFTMEGYVSARENGYEVASNYLSIYREASSADRRFFHIRFLGFNLDEAKTPLTAPNTRVVFFIDNDHSYENKNTAFTVILTSKQNDIMQGTFSGQLVNAINNRNEVLTVKGSFSVPIKRF